MTAFPRRLSFSRFEIVAMLAVCVLAILSLWMSQRFEPKKAAPDWLFDAYAIDDQTVRRRALKPPRTECD